jgi:hypothetical protein
VGVDDPQLLALVFSRAGVYVYLRGDRRGWALELAALLFVAGGNIKHNMIEFPLAVLLNLVISSPRRALRFAVGDGSTGRHIVPVCCLHAATPGSSP